MKKMPAEATFSGCGVQLRRSRVGATQVT